jgi:hypothetical protein
MAKPREFQGEGPRKTRLYFGGVQRRVYSPPNRLFDKPYESPNRLFTGTISEARFRIVEMERNQLRTEQFRLRSEVADLRRELTRISETVRPGLETMKLPLEQSAESSREFRKEQATEAKEDYEQIIRGQLEELGTSISRMTDELTKAACSTQISRIKKGIERAIGAGIATDDDANAQAYTLSIINNYLLLASTALSAHAQDEAERKLVDQIGDVLKGKLATQIWVVLSKLGRVQQWTVNGDLTVSLFGLVKGNTGLSMTFAR